MGPQLVGIGAIIVYHLNAMLVFAHTGLALGAAWLAQNTAQRFHAPTARMGRRPKTIVGSSHQRSGWPALLSSLDLRFILVGSMLPDIIDKPLGQVILRRSFSSGRIFAHTILLNTVGLVLSAVLYLRRRDSRVLGLFMGAAAHLMLDEIWLMPETAFWPLYGWKFEHLDLSEWGSSIVASLLSDPRVYVPEIAGAVILGVFGVQLLFRQRVRQFLGTGVA